MILSIADTVIIVKKDKLVLDLPTGEMFFHPNMAQVRMKRLRCGDIDNMLEAMGGRQFLPSGDRLPSIQNGRKTESSRLDHTKQKRIRRRSFDEICIERNPFRPSRLLYGTVPRQVLSCNDG